MIAIVLSILLPGLGQFYYGKNVRAIVMFVLALTPLYPIALIWSVIDIVRLNRQGIQPAFELKEAMWAILLLLVVVPVCLFVAFSGMFALGQWYSNKHLKAAATIEEGNTMASAIHRYHKRTGKYPTDISTLMGNIPVRSSWRTDGWGELYVYELEDGGSLRLLSKGKDGILGTEDDIVFK